MIDGGNLMIKAARMADTGNYQCTARNQAGLRETSPVRLQVHGESDEIND